MKNSTPPHGGNPPNDHEIKASLKQWLPIQLREIYEIHRDLSAELLGYYLSITAVIWEKGGEVSSDIISISRICNVRRNKAERIKKSLAPYFNENNKKWHHPWLLAKLERGEHISKERQKAARSRWNNEQKMDANAYANAFDNPMQMQCNNKTEQSLTLVDEEDKKHEKNVLDELTKFKNNFVGPLLKDGTL